ncbi:hypothetical protein CASFOL_001945 [Castilleja foliolosa]|uniref:Uncharacterized protein n=1 Tax=Castilleja foliolosa TaxID=1961234 RepID=A0ABD3EGW0_9LAMI
MSKVTPDVIGEVVATISTESKERNRNFTQKKDLQIGLKNYDPQKICMLVMPSTLKRKDGLVAHARNKDDTSFDTSLVIAVEIYFRKTRLKESNPGGMIYSVHTCKGEININTSQASYIRGKNGISNYSDAQQILNVKHERIDGACKALQVLRTTFIVWHI